jgi:hypothetical protein
MVRECMPSTRCLVLQSNQSLHDWSGFGPTKEGRDMFKWIRENWD